MEDPADKPDKSWHPPRPSWQYQLVELLVVMVVLALLAAGAAILYRLIF